VSRMGAERRDLVGHSNQQTVLQIGLSKQRWTVAGALDCRGAVRWEISIHCLRTDTYKRIWENKCLKNLQRK